jgi:hypothetical protein
MSETTAWEDEDLVLEDPNPPLPLPIEEEEVMTEAPPAAAEPGTPKEYTDTTLWKKWSVSGGVGRFLTVRPWIAAGKVAADIGETEGGGPLKGHTLAWANTLQLTTFLTAVRDGRGTVLYKATAKEPAENYAYFGGAMIEGQPVSRILKIHHWPLKDGKFDDTAFIWKCGHFKADKSKTGAFIPKDMKNPISFHSIKVNRLEMAELATAMHMVMVNHAANTTPNDWLEQVSGRKR